MQNTEFKKVYKQYYSPKPGKPEILNMPTMQFVMIDGKGDPNNSREFEKAVGTLYNVVYSLKFSRKKAGKSPDFSIGALESIWWTDTGKQFDVVNKNYWLWTLMIWLPDFISRAEFMSLVSKLKTRKPDLMLDKVRLESLNEGTIVQIMHTGPYANEQKDIETMHTYAADLGYAQSGKHHEIYFGEPRRTPSVNLRTILRQPIKRVQKV